MANAQSKNVLIIDTDNYTKAGPFKIETLVYFPGSGSPNAEIKMTNTSGQVMWSAHSGSSRLNEQVEIHFDQDDTMHVDLSGTGTTLYLYLCDE